MAKVEQLDLDEFGAVGTLAFNAEACELANLLACVSQLCQKLNLPPPKELYRPTFFKMLLALNFRRAVWLWYGGCSFVCRSARITGLLSASLVQKLGIGCASCLQLTLLLTPPRKLTKLRPQPDW